MAASPFQSALEAALAPLEFAARDGAPADRVRDLEPTVAAAVERAQRLAIPRDARDALRAAGRALAGAQEGERRAAALLRALRRLRPLAEPGWAEAALARSTGALPGVGPRRAALLAKRGLRSVGDLLFHLPVRYDDRRQLSRVGDLEVGRRATFVATVAKCGFVERRRRGPRALRPFRVEVGDGTGSVDLVWFRGGDATLRQLRQGARLLVTGEVTRYRFSLQLTHPEILVLEDGAGEGGPGEDWPRVVAEYASPEGIHPRALRRMVEHAVAGYADLVAGHLPEDLVRARSLPEPAQALRALHAPDAQVDLEALSGRRDANRARLVLEELYLLEVGLAMRRARRARAPGIAIAADGPRVERALAGLPFDPTAAQRRVWEEIRGDLRRPHPMNRLLEGDVGSGKTVIAFLAGLAAAESGLQTALMAPTELLAEQHARTLAHLARACGEGPRLALLTASLARADAEAVRRDLASGAVDLAVGTHALFQQAVGFARLGLVVTDEQHRFGVEQRAALARKAGRGGSAAPAPAPHVLVMTATPIPRTLALTVYGDLDLSVIDELPPGRQPVQTLLLRSGEGERAAALLREATGRGEQAYVVYPLVAESEKIDLRAATESAARIARAFPDLSVDLVHGRLDAAARAAAMARFERGETQVLVSTTVIEVGVDVSAATLMIVEHAERFGLAQLHQLRGRVGRGSRPGTCVLVARGSGEDSEARLAALLATTDGFAIAEADLRLRGPGEFLGTRQHGRLPDLRIADLMADARHIAAAREAALETLRRDPGLARAPELARAVRARWGERLALAGVG